MKQSSPMFYGAPPQIIARAKELRSNMTPSESCFWSLVSKNRLRGYKIRRQHPIAVYVVDFYCHELRLAIEIDGGIHLEKEVMRYDEIREHDLTLLGIKVLRFTNEQVQNDSQEVLNRVEKYIDQLLIIST